MAKKKELKLIRLRNLKKGSKICMLEVKISNKKHTEAVIIFDHTDGMYSYNTVNDKNGNQLFNKDGSPALVHLSRMLILKKVDEHYEVASEDEAKQFKD